MKQKFRFNNNPDIMAQLTAAQRVFVVKKYHETGSYRAVQEQFRLAFPGRNPPAKRTIQQNVRKYNLEGTSLNLNKGRSGRRRTERTDQNIQTVQGLLGQQQITCRRNTLGLSKSTFNRIVKSDLQWHPYKIHEVQKLEPADYGRRVTFCRWFSQHAPNIRFLSNVVVGDEAIFSMNGHVSTQNVRCYAPKGQPPDFKFERHHSREKLHVWIGLCGNGELIGPYFFNRNVNGRTYGDMLTQFVFPAISRIFQKFGLVFDGIWWIQDGAPAHRTLLVRRMLQQKFEDRIVALHHGIEWPPRSPDLTPCDFFLWGYLKNKVYSSAIHSLPELRRRLLDETNTLRQNQHFIRRSFQEMARRANLCVQRNGGHVETA
jgi:hypothetical protein